MTLLPPLKQITTLRLPKLSIFDPQPKSPIVSEIEPLPPTPSEVLYQIGSQLRQLREQRNLSIEDISTRTQLQPRSIQAIEEGHIEMLPEPVYVKGMVKRYANSLGLDGLTISQQVPTWEKEDDLFTQPTVRQTTSFNTPQIKPFHVYLGYTLAILGIGAGISPLLNNAIKPKPSLVTGAALPKIVAPKQTLLTQPQGVNIGIVVTSPTWAQIGSDGTTKFTGNLKVGDKFNFVATKQVTISTNNAGGLLFARDRQPAQLLGKLGQKQHVTIKVGKY